MFTASQSETPPFALNKDKDFKNINREMFDGIAHRYDFLNHFLSFGIDILWRKKTIALLKKENPKVILDVATGTADLAIEALSLNPDKIFGIDVSEKMLAVGNEKIAKKNLQEKIELLTGDSENIPFTDNKFDAVTVSFGVRNFSDLQKGLSEMNRVLKQNGTIAILEFSNPDVFPVKQLYGFYFSTILPFLGKKISGHGEAYSYLHDSVVKFPEGKDFIKILEQTGFTQMSMKRLMGGIATIYTAKK